MQLQFHNYFAHLKDAFVNTIYQLIAPENLFRWFFLEQLIYIRIHPLQPQSALTSQCLERAKCVATTNSFARMMETAEVLANDDNLQAGKLQSLYFT